VIGTTPLGLTFCIRLARNQLTSLAVGVAPVHIDSVDLSDNEKDWKQDV